MKKARIVYILGGLFLISSLALNVYVLTLLFELKGKIDNFYQKDFVEVRVVSELLVKDIERYYGEKLPFVELSIRLSKYSDTGIMYDGKVLRLFLPPMIIDFSDDQKRAYLAHEFGHYVLGHMDHQNPNIYSFFGAGNLDRDIQADIFALGFTSTEDISSAIKKLVWDEKERKIRLFSVGGD